MPKDADTENWTTLADYDAWCRENMMAFNLLAITNEIEWERIAQKIERWLNSKPRQHLSESPLNLDIVRRGRIERDRDDARGYEER